MTKNLPLGVQESDKSGLMNLSMVRQKKTGSESSSSSTTIKVHSSSFKDKLVGKKRTAQSNLSEEVQP